jgi:hypothetical protein
MDLISAVRVGSNLDFDVVVVLLPPDLSHSETTPKNHASTPALQDHLL